MKLEAVAEILTDEGVAQQGKTLFINFMPTDVVKGVLLRDPFGGSKIDYELRGYNKTSFMLIVRGPDHGTVKQLMNDAIEALLIEQETVKAGLHIRYMRPRHEPLVYAPSPASNIEMITNIDCSYNIV